MIRPSQQSDTENIIEIWLQASIEAHTFASAEFWHSKVVDMREIYLPAAQTFVDEHEGEVKGFISMYRNNIAALFVLPRHQAKGIGTRLLKFIQGRHEQISLCVYKDNTASIAFYKKHGFRRVAEQLDEHTGHPEIIMQYNA